MECNPNEPIDTVCSDTLGQTIYFGLTKREHMAIEFTKSLLVNDAHIDNAYNAQRAIYQADELIKQLNQTKTT